MNPNYLGYGGIDLFHALVFKVRNFKHDEVALDILPTKRNSYQRYVMTTHEAPRRDFSKNK